MIEAKEILKHVDHTLLRADSTWEEIEALCDEAVAFGTASVCVPPTYIKRICNAYGERVTVCTVIGFPLGYSVTAAKVAEAQQAVADGAEEVDMVINLCDAKNGDFDKIEREIVEIKEACGGKILKVIVETCYLDEQEKIAACKAVTNAGADYIKTSTGFGTAGATLADIRLFREYIGPDVKIKAAGGMQTYGDFVAFLEAGADRLGTSKAVGVIREKRESKTGCD